MLGFSTHCTGIDVYSHAIHYAKLRSSWNFPVSQKPVMNWAAARNFGFSASRVAALPTRGFMTWLCILCEWFVASKADVSCVGFSLVRHLISFAGFRSHGTFCANIRSHLSENIIILAECNAG